MTDERDEFKPAWWLRNSHLQTLWPAIFRSDVKHLALQRERIELPDGDFIDLDWVNRSHIGAPLVIILHGLEGSIESHYSKGMLAQIASRGWRGLFMHFRGCSGEPNRLVRGYHSGDTEDVSYVIDLLCKREPSIEIAAIGYSLGGNVLLKWLGETGNANPLTAAIAISVPFELHKAAARIKHGFSKFYQWYFLMCICDRLEQKFKQVSAPFDSSIFREVKSMDEFDDKVTAPIHGFKDAYEYYQHSSSRQYLKTIEVPTLILHAKDDPFMSEDVIPQTNELSSNVILEVSEGGGHVGFVSGKYPWRAEYWLEKRVPNFLDEFWK